jgi:hypothetical protein
MNHAQMKKNRFARVKLQPAANRLNQYGQELAVMDDDWIIEDVADAGVHISNPVTGHKTILGYDHIHHFTSNPNRSQSELKFGFLTLNVQISLQGNKVLVEPTRPGEPRKPPRVEIVEKWVEIDYPSRSGIKKKLENEGYSVGWCWDTRLPQLVDVQGWEVVVERDTKGTLTKFRTSSGPDQTLIKKRNG